MNTDEMKSQLAAEDAAIASHQRERDRLAAAPTREAAQAALDSVRELLEASA